MAYFAEINSDNVVLRVVSISDSDTANGDGDEVESLGVAFCQNLLVAALGNKQVTTIESAHGLQGRIYL